MSIVGGGGEMTSEAPNPSSFVGLPFSLRSVCACAQLCVVCTLKSLWRWGFFSGPAVKTGLPCRGPGVISGCGSSAGLRVWQKKKKKKSA